jgi:hypothetical protein
MTTTRVFSRLARLLAGGAAPQTANGHVAVWITRLQRDDNPWLKAERMEQQGELDQARRLYLQDADQQIGRGHHGRVAVARAASAEITARLGNRALAVSERQRAAEEFRRHAEEAMAWSIREAAWSYERAAALYARAGLRHEAEAMRRCATDLNLHLELPLDGLNVPPAPTRDALVR